MILGRNIIDVVFVLFWLFGCFVFVFVFVVWLLIVFDSIAKTNNKITKTKTKKQKPNRQTTKQLNNQTTKQQDNYLTLITDTEY